MKLLNRWVAGLSAVALVLLASTTALAYSGQVKGSLSISIKATLTCGGSITAHATLLDADGAPIVGQSVAWSLVTTQSSADKIDNTATVTNAKGVATTTLTLAAVEGIRKVRATVTTGDAATVSATAAINVHCDSLPNTSTLPTEAPASTIPLLAMILAFVVGGALALRRLGATGR